MKQPIFIKNMPINEKRIGFIELILSRLVRRTQKTTKAMISPIPISACAYGEDISGTIMRAILFAGKITKGAIQLKTNTPGEVRVSIRVDGRGMSYYMDKLREVIDLELDTLDGSVLDVSVYSPEEIKVTEILASILWVPSKSDIEVKQFLIDELEEQANVYLEGDEEVRKRKALPGGE